jgi:hypothetical protein
MKIHLSIIAGNEAELMERFLKSFSPHVDRITVAIAHGNTEPDRTEQICREHGCDVLHYKNSADFPHVDNFAAARNLSWNAARIGADFLLWADCDDLLTPTGAEVLDGIRSGNAPEADVVQGLYIVSAQGATARRTRLVRADIDSKWVNAVHEDIEFPADARVVYCPELQFLHAPQTNKRASTNRNRAILEAVPVDNRTASEWWYLMSECDIQGDYVAAVEAAVIASASADLPTPQKYHAYMTIGRRIVEPEEAERPLLECVRLSPDRREAFGELAQMHLQRGDAAKALAYAKIMDAIPSPAPRPQNHDPSIYGWRAHDILCHAESVNGINPSKRRKAWHKEHGIRISVIHPTCRPEKALETRKIWMDRATKPENIEYIFGINSKEPLGPVEHYHHALSEPVPEGYSSAVANYNAAAAAATGPIIIAAQDDIYPPHGWDEGVWKLLSPYTGQSKVLHVFDGFSTSQLMVIMCVTRAWLKKHGTLLSPEYDGYFSDTEYSFRTYRDGEVIDGRALKFYHDHPAFTGAASDESYMRQQNPVAFERGRSAFRRRNPDCNWT